MKILKPDWDSLFPKYMLTPLKISRIQTLWKFCDLSLEDFIQKIEGLLDNGTLLDL